MENLNAEQVKKALQCFHQRILDTHLADDIREGEMMAILDALALINLQEQRIKELAEERNKVSEKGAEILTRLEEAYLKLESENLKLAEENEDLKVPRYLLREDGGVELMPTIKSIKADTVRKMQERLKAECNKYLLHSTITLMLRHHIDQIAKEMLEGADNGIQNQ